ncbi:hypothetical protein SAM23877_0478 [Streptomyces ambofaciens ATCC 23877]|uniref:Uncharacterized protein n=1 Tax=Streptomyces ambofaciens (strain ATCC 23877 / 3486 / DSM 40053 / JCM 4204 / NBRC 12836 / NRRL B-2516) TaxID=278992 RepID=A0A0K2AL11_STRA7|nr:hypothetical protein [Streptomyces ambofaciens]AKZ53527.1 hypothetical protein SAM23877_0478 [Streptomyces ambofaciens ATCC 23877]
MLSGAPTTRSQDEPSDTAAGVSLAAQAALLETRALMLREALDAVDASMRETSERLARLRQQSGDGSRQVRCGEPPPTAR